jgi:hypothetical protein
LSKRDIADYADHPAIGRNSKSGAGFERGERQLDQVRAREVYGDEIEKVAEWIRVVGERRGVSAGPAVQALVPRAGRGPGSA